MWNYPPKEILVPVDFGEASDRALVVAGIVAREYGSHLVALHAETLEAPPYFTRDQLTALERQRVSARKDVERYLAKAAGHLAGGSPDVVVSDGSPAAAIVELASTRDLIVMGTHGRRGPSRWWLGSVAERVVREAPAPVLVVRAATGPPASMFGRILVVAAQKTFDGPAVRYAEGLASSFKGQVIEEVGRCEDDIARERGATLLVVALRTPVGLFGDTTERVLRTCTVPMLFIKS